jgi:hypothetical protein
LSAFASCRKASLSASLCGWTPFRKIHPGGLRQSSRNGYGDPQHRPKNGKTGLIAGILLAHLVGPEAVQNTQIVSGALSREQAAIVFNLAVKMVNLNPKLQEIVHITPSGKKLIGLPCNVEYKALSAEGKRRTAFHRFWPFSMKPGR